VTDRVRGVRNHGTESLILTRLTKSALGSGTKIQGYLDGKLYLEHTLAQLVSGRIGLWSKADSHMYFSDYTVTAAN
jgi:hypothetical protein